MSAYSAICFDLFDTLITFDPIRYRIDQIKTAKALDLDTDAFLLAWKSTHQPALAGVYGRFELRCKAVLKQLDIHSDSALFRLINRELHALQEAVSPVPGVHEMLTDLVRLRFRLAIISNASCIGPAILKAVSLDNYFHECVFSFIEKRWKPDPEIYLLSCDRLRVQPDETIFVSDGDRNELDGALKAGLTPIRFDPENCRATQPVPPGTASFTRISDLTAFLMQITGKSSGRK